MAADNTPMEIQGEVQMGFFSARGFELLQRVAGMFSKSSLVPQAYQDNISNCAIALNMAQRLNADALMVMQNLYVVYGTPSWSSKFLIATFNTCGRFSSLRYKFTGTKGNDDYGCIAYAVESATGETLEGSEVTIDIAKKEGWYNKKDKSGKEMLTKWKTMPQQMLMYRAASWFVRAYAPEVSMGLYTVDEIEDSGPINITPVVEKPLNEIHENANKEILTAELPQAQPVIDIPKNVNESPKTVAEKVEIVNKTTKTATKGPDF